MVFPAHQMLLVMICLFSLIELIITCSIHVLYPCESHKDVLYFIEASALIGFFGTLFYFVLKELNKKHPTIYLIFSNIYIVSMICLGLYWLIGLAIESRRFFDHFEAQPCQPLAFYSLLVALMGHYLVLLLLIIYSLCFYHSSIKQKQDLPAQVALIR